MSSDSGKALGERYLRARNTPDLDLLDTIYAPDVLVHDCSAPMELRGVEALKAFYAETHKGFPDFRIEWDDVIESGDRVVFRWTIEATHTGELRGMPPSGKHVRFSGVAIDRLENERIVEEWVYFNVLDLLAQLGVAPQPPGASV